MFEFSGNRFVILGRAGMDLYPDPPGVKTEEATHFFTCLGGSSANTGVALVRLGGEAFVVTTISDDAVGCFVFNELKKYGINSDYVRFVGGEARTSLAVVESRIEDHQSVIYRNGAADFQMSVEDVEAVDYVSFAGLVSTGTILAAEPSRTAAFHSFGLAKEAQLPLVLDLDYRPYSWESKEVAADNYSRAAGMCDVIVGNELEFDTLSNGDGLAEARRLAREDGKLIIYKMGENGSITMTPDREFSTPVFPTNPLKPTGAGDSFLGGFLSSMASGFGLEESVRRGSACAAMVVARVGCAPAMPTLDELEDFLSRFPVDNEF